MELFDDGSARALLRLLRNPQTVISNVDEKCVVGTAGIQRTVAIRVDTKALPRKSPIVVDLLRPAKGMMPRLEGLDEAVVRVLNHEEHVYVSQEVIVRRFFTVLASVKAPTSIRERVATEALDSLIELQKIPAESPDKARRIFHRQFTSGVLDVFYSDARVSVSAKHMRRLYLLCEMLVGRYLLLAQLRESKSEEVTIAFSIVQTMSDTPDPAITSARKFRNRVHQKILNRRHQWRLRLGVPVPRLRIHVPWAKRTDHYSFWMDPPSGYFFTEQKIVEAKNSYRPDKPVRFSKVRPSVKWSIDPHGGRRSSVFVGAGHSAKHRVYLGYVIQELPFSHSFRAMIVATMTSALTSVFVLLRSAGVDFSTDAAALAAALFAAASLSIEVIAASGNSPFLSPLLPRLVTFASMMQALGLSVWLSWKPVKSHPGTDREKWIYLVYHFGGWALLGSAILVLLAIFRRNRRIGREHASTSAQAAFMSNLY